MMPSDAHVPFGRADILLPRDCSYEKWAVVACDQYTSQPEYWQRVEEFVGGAPSALRLILPESCLDGPNVETDIVEINNTMTHYLREERFRRLPASMIYVERTLEGGAVRRGLLGAVDLEAYDYEEDSRAPVRATEGVDLNRLPPRVSLRKNASLELPHALLLADDPEDRLMGWLSGEREHMEPLYDFDLMEGGWPSAGVEAGAGAAGPCGGAPGGDSGPRDLPAAPRSGGMAHCPAGGRREPLSGHGQGVLRAAKAPDTARAVGEPPGPVRPGRAGQPPRREPDLRAGPPGALRRGAQ